ncbi:hypothetical protein MPC4_170002 [Methylocella tundrae]|uniref:Uncharacterized protein n=1 Tax=Methylocella tundrae TaxID=227605 RepID=A0A8B6M351_METTU|nr:hypothetical protein [Methylocella tundrae]VTZ24055.1 hypothetical protein MPC1_16120002 [Methylocella tundrae]VTZ49471.1 hypothetical protein MPC4_170002 [Methylocella tundrae]
MSTAAAASLFGEWDGPGLPPTLGEAIVLDEIDIAFLRLYFPDYL